LLKKKKKKKPNRGLQICEWAVNQYQQNSDLVPIILGGGGRRQGYLCREMKLHDGVTRGTTARKSHKVLILAISRI